MTQVWVFRHAESLANAGAKTLDPEGIPLTARGKDDAVKLASSLRDAPQKLIISPFKRALETASPIAARFPLADQEVWPIHEFTYLKPASCVGTSWVERKPRIDAYWARLDPSFVDGEGAESFSTLLARARAFLEDLADERDRLLAVVSHGQFMQAAKLMAQRPDMDERSAMATFLDRQTRRPFANCERLTLSVEGSKVRVMEP